MDIAVVWYSFVLLFVAELGDKTQLMAIGLAHRYPARPVVVGVLLAFAVLNLLAVLFGAALYRFLPGWLILFAAGCLFLFFAWKSWRDADAQESTVAPAAPARHAMVSSFSLIFVAELGDKTQLALIGLAAGSGAPWSAFVGATLALWTISLAAILLGNRLLRRLPRQRVQQAAALLFAVFGILALGGLALGTLAD